MFKYKLAFIDNIITKLILTAFNQKFIVDRGIILNTNN